MGGGPGIARQRRAAARCRRWRRCCARRCWRWSPAPARSPGAPARPASGAAKARFPGASVCWTLLALCLLVGPTITLMGHYHVLGTDLTGNDVLYQSLKSIRTAFVIGTLATRGDAAAGGGAGHPGRLLQRLGRRGRSSTSTPCCPRCPNVLLIAACVLMVQVFLDKQPGAVRDRRRARRPEAVPAVRGARPDRLGRPVPAAARRDAEAARAGIRAGGAVPSASPRAASWGATSSRTWRT